MKQIIVLILLAADLEWQSYEAHAGKFGSVTKNAAGKVIPKPKSVNVPATWTEKMYWSALGEGLGLSRPGFLI